MPRHKVVKQDLRVEVFFATLIAVLAIGFVVMLNTVSDRNKQIETLERELYLTQNWYGVVIIDDNGGYVCTPPRKIRRDWEAVVKQRCDELAKVMFNARLER